MCIVYSNARKGHGESFRTAGGTPSWGAKLQGLQHERSTDAKPVPNYLAL